MSLILRGSKDCLQQSSPPLILDSVPRVVPALWAANEDYAKLTKGCEIHWKSKPSVAPPWQVLDNAQVVISQWKYLILLRWWVMQIRLRKRILLWRRCFKEVCRVGRDWTGVARAIKLGDSYSEKGSRHRLVVLWNFYISYYRSLSPLGISSKICIKN